LNEISVKSAEAANAEEKIADPVRLFNRKGKSM